MQRSRVNSLKINRLVLSFSCREACINPIPVFSITQIGSDHVVELYSFPVEAIIYIYPRTGSTANSYWCQSKKSGRARLAVLYF